MWHSSPIIVIGMHRSGTTMISQLLKDAGVFMGQHVEANNEARFFLGLNEWAFWQCGARWDYPSNIGRELCHERTRVIIANCFADTLNSASALFYTGIRRELGKRFWNRTEGFWGWKDPRNTFTLPVWLRLFPNARIISVTRHPIDVANSLRVRAERTISPSNRLRRRSQKTIYGELVNKLATTARGVIALHAPSGAGSLRCLRVEGAVELWREYVEEGDRQVAPLSYDQYIQVKYEEFLSEPSEQFAKILSFIGMDQSAAERIVEGKVKKQRKLAYVGDAGLQQLYQTYKGDPTLVRHGY